MATAITKPPKNKVNTHKRPERDGYALKTSWKIPKEATKDSDHRATKQHSLWTLVYDEGSKKGIKLIRGGYINNVTSLQQSVSINNYKTTNASRASEKGKTFTRKSFYPFTSRKLVRADHALRLENAKVTSKNRGKVPVSKSTTTFGVPAAPGIGAFSFDTETGTVSVKITAAASTELHERYQTRYTFKVEYGAYNKRTQMFDVKSIHRNESSTFTGGDKTLSHDCTGYQTLADLSLYRVTVTAFSQGMSGDSGQVSRVFIIAPPASVTITGVSATAGGAGRTVVSIRTNNVTYKKKVGNNLVDGEVVNPVTGVVLQAAVNVTAKTAAAVPGDAWDDVGAVDNGNCAALTANSADLAPEVNNYSYVRVKSYRFDAECAPMCRYSNIVALTSLRTVDTAADDESAILALTPLESGDGVEMIIGYDKKGEGTRDDSDGTEVSWSTSSKAWTSTKRPETFECDWADPSAKKSGESDASYQSQYYYPYRDVWHYCQRIYVEDLEEGEEYWFRCRRYNDDSSGNRTYGSYCQKIWGTASSSANVTEDAKCMPVTKPTLVEASIPTSAPTASDVTLSWTHDGGGQTAYRIYLGGTTRVYKTVKSAMSSCVLKYDDYKDYVRDNQLTVAVDVSTSKRCDVYTLSDPVSVTFAEPPTIEASVPTVTAQPATAYLYSTTDATHANVTITALGTGGVEEVGIEPQEDGDDVYGASIPITWERTTWGDTPWYADNVQTLIDAADDAWDVLTLTTDTYEGSVDATLVEVTLDMDDGREQQATRHYLVVEPSDVPGAYMSASLSVDDGQESTNYDLGGAITWCDSQGAEDAEGAYLRLPWPLVLDDDDILTTLAASTVTLTYLTSGDENDELWQAYTTARAASDAARAIQDPTAITYVGEVTIPASTDFRDGARYRLTASVTNALGLVSNTATTEFGVAWAHQAPEPSDSVTVTPSDSTDADGIRTIGATIKLAAPDGAAEGDMADIWRVASDGYHLIAEGRTLTDEVLDTYAPFGDADLAYRVVVRTADGDVNFADFGYSLPINHTRIDFGDSYVELPYNIKISHGYSKESEQRAHLGESLPRGYWGAGRTRTFSVSSDLIRSASRDQRRLLHELGRYMGPVLVRTPDGCCMEAEVTPDLSISHDSSAVPAQIRGTEIELTEEHMAVAFEPEPEPQEP